MSALRADSRLALAAVIVSFAMTGAAAKVPESWRTPAERSGYRATPSYEETLDFLRMLQSRAPDRLRLATFGRSAEGRDMPFVIASDRGAFNPSAAHDAGLPVVLIQCGIHAGEIDGKDAMLAILRDLATGRAPDLVGGLTLLVIPIYNVDGHERVSPTNRANQIGPAEGVGFRTTSNGLDLNRDHLKLDTPEARALVTLVNAWQPDLHVDVHVTDGSDHGWVLTWSTAEAPQLAPSLSDWLDTHLPAILEATAAAGVANGPYVDLLDPADPTGGFSSAVIEPRFSTGYFALRNVPSILVEMHAYKPYGQRVLGVETFVRSLLTEVAAAGDSLRQAHATADDATVTAGRRGAPPSHTVVRWRLRDGTDTATWPVYDWLFEDSVVTGAPLLFYRRGENHTIDVPWRHRVDPEFEVTRPRGYLIPPGWPQIESRILDHGLEIARLSDETTLDVETIRVSDPVFAGSSYQGRIRLETFTTRRARERRTVAAGALWIPADQPLFEIAVQLLEPEAPDSLMRWGAISSVFERKAYIDLRTLEPLARTMLRDESTRQAWQEALEDPDFAADLRARWLWWYRRTRFWDETVGLVPAYRVPELTPELRSHIR